MFRIAFLEQRGNGLEVEERLVREVFESRGIPVELYTRKRIERRNLPLDAHAFIMGTTPSMHGAMKQLGIEIPAPNDYPQALRHLLHRRVWSATLGDIERALYEGRQGPVFVKPADRLKTFTGRVFESPADLYFLGRASRQQQVWCSEVVQWRSEFRAYVAGEKVLALDHYQGDPEARPRMQVIEEAVAAYRRSGEAPSAYGIDFGVLPSGETALVEANDGYSLGAYQVAAPLYAEVLLTRWAELLAKHKASRDLGA
ncbi:ATP-grasp domain-containing protein [Variovorax sp. UC122_21]|uniref:ATP-grasp domain-containing protein n=1 Tax=Variovorax sp. UC122_21 TaxID=3374554 RepID=UPI003756B0BD